MGGSVNTWFFCKYTYKTRKEVNAMKKLNVTRENYEKSTYFQNKYGKLKMMNESGTLFKTDKGRILQFVKENAEDDWLDEYLKDGHQKEFDSLLEWVKKKNPDMNEKGQERFARNILKKRHRKDMDSGAGKKGDDDEKKPESPTSHEIRTASEEDEARFCKELTNYQADRHGTVRKERWLTKKELHVTKKDLKRGAVRLEWWKPVGFDEDGKVLLDKFLGKLEKVDSFKDGDYDDGQQHSWTDVSVSYVVDKTNKVGEDVGEIKDGDVVLSDGTVLSGGGLRMHWSWIENEKWWRSSYGRRRW